MTQANPEDTKRPLTISERVSWMRKNDPDLWADWMGDDGINDENLAIWLTENGVPEFIE